MNQITIDNILLVEVPNLATQFEIVRDEKEEYLKHDTAPFAGSSDKLSPGNWQFIGTTDAITEEIAMKIVKEPTIDSDTWDSGTQYSRTETWKNWYCYEAEGHELTTALESYQSWLRAFSINANIRYAILKLNP